MFGIDLTIDQFNPFALQLLHVENKGIFACVTHGAEHALAEKDLPHPDAIKATDEGRSLPDFRAMGVTGQVKRNIGFTDFVRDPGTLLSTPGDRLAPADDLAEIGVDPELERPAADQLPHALAFLQLRREEDESRV